MTAARTLLITGVASGLGRAFARAAIGNGWAVVGTVRRSTDARRFQDETGATALLHDLEDTSRAPALIAEAERLSGPIDVLVNNAGHGHEGSLEESPIDALRRQLDVNVIGQVAMIQAVLPGMRERRRGHIVNVTSMAGSVGLPGVSFYCAAKFAMEGLGDALAKEVRSFGIHVTSFAPGQFRTAWAGRSLERSPRRVDDYDALIGPLRDARIAKNGLQAGDPRKAAALLMRVIASPQPPARLFVGPDALALAGQKVRRMTAEMAGWQAESRQTNFDPDKL